MLHALAGRHPCGEASLRSAGFGARCSRSRTSRHGCSLIIGACGAPRRICDRPSECRPSCRSDGSLSFWGSFTVGDVGLRSVFFFSFSFAAFCSTSTQGYKHACEKKDSADSTISVVQTLVRNFCTASSSSQSYDILGSLWSQKSVVQICHKAPFARPA